MRRGLLTATFGSLILAGAASAQPWPARVLIDVNVAAASAGSTFSDRFTYPHPYSANIPGEEASVETSVKIPGGALFEGGALVRLSGHIAAGIAYYQSSATRDLDVTARIPHPFFIGRHRTVEGTTPARHKQTGLHLNGAYVVPATGSLYVAVSGGPTYFTVSQGMVTSVAVSEAYPYDTATFASADVEPATGSGWGYNAGLDVGWMFTRNLGVGALVRYSNATLSVKPTSREARDVKVGGLHAGAGARIAF